MPQVHDLYNGRVQISLDDDHKYDVMLDGVKVDYVPGTTGITGSIAKPQLVPWAVKACADYVEQHHWKSGTDKAEFKAMLKEAKREHERIKELSATIGTAVHGWVEEFVEQQQGLRTELSDRVIPAQWKEDYDGCVAAFRGWHDQVGVEYLESEVLVYSISHNFAGKFDLIVRDSSKKILPHLEQPARILIDAKTSNSLYAEHIVQLSGYWGALREERGVESAPSHAALLHLGKEGMANLLVFDEKTLAYAYDIFRATKFQQQGIKDLEKLL